MTTLASSGKPRSLLRHEWSLFITQLGQIRDQIINGLFGLTFERAEWRGRTLALLFLFLTGLTVLRAHPLPEWGNHVRNIFIYLFNPVVRQTFTTNPFSDMLRFALEGWPLLMRYLPIIILPFVIALQNAAKYLADIFEKPIDLARRFIWEVALGGGSETAVISDGEFKNKDESLIYTIGGPGFVMVAMDSAALFEKPDGTPNVIGPTINGPARLTGFERFRQAVDLRDQHIQLDDGRGVSERTRDGIVVRAADVQIRFSIDRGGELKKKSLKEPFPFRSKQVIERLIYEERREVRKRSKPLAGSGQYRSRNSTLSITSLLHAEFKKFIAERKLTEFLASYSQPEVRRMQELKVAIERQKQTLLPDDRQTENTNVEEKTPKFTARPEVTAIFKEGLGELYLEKGLDLIWIDIGTWKTPAAIVPELHFEAWLISSKNAAEGNEKAIEAGKKKALLDKTIKMIQNIPIARYHEIAEGGIMTHREGVRDIVNAYREQLIEAKDFLEKEILKNVNPAEARRDLATLQEAIAFIEEILRNSQFHWRRY